MKWIWLILLLCGCQHKLIKDRLMVKVPTPLGNVVVVGATTNVVRVEVTINAK